MLFLALGGLGLFLLGMSLLTAGLKLVGGSSLRSILLGWTKSRPRAFLTGFAATAIVQSSSAVTVSVIGFVNAGLLDMARSIWLVFGSNVGTTMTAWIVALVGLKFNVEIISLPAIGIGTLVHLFSSKARWKALGGAMPGLGLLFLGLQFMQDAFSGIDPSMGMNWVASSLWQLPLMVLMGAVMTALMQSSSASIAVVLTAVSTGMLGLEVGAAAVIGANVGTTITAVLAVLKATSSARRLAMAHIIFNLVAALVALLMLGLLLAMVSELQNFLGLESSPAVSLAIFHTLFNLVGAVIMIPFEPKLIRWLNQLFVSQTEQIARPQFLDSATAKSPDRALGALMHEERRLLKLSGELVRSELQLELEQAEQRIQSIQTLIERINDFVVEASVGEVPEEVARSFQEVIALNIHVANMLENYEEVCRHQRYHVNSEIDAEISSLANNLAHLVELGLSEDATNLDLSNFQEEFDQHYNNTFDRLRGAAQRGQISMRSMESATRYLATFRRIVRQYLKALGSLQHIKPGEVKAG